MSNLTWQQNNEGGYYANTEDNGMYVLRKRNDGYFNVFHRPKGGAWEDEIKLNDKRVRLHAAKDIAQIHYDSQQPTEPTKTVDAGRKEYTCEKCGKKIVIETPDEGPNKDYEPAKPILCQSCDPNWQPKDEVEQRSDPTATDGNHLQTMTEGQWDQKIDEEDAIALLTNAETKGERRRIRKELRKNGYPALAGLSV